MDVLLDNLGGILDGFATTLKLFAISAVLCLILGTLLAAMRVSPFRVLRATGTGYVTVVRNTPLVLMFVLIVFGLPEIGFRPDFDIRAILALTLYTAAFVCEAVRSGINAVQPGQAEAARSLGMTFRQTLGLVVLPQAVRSVVPPLVSILIALTKNTAVAEVFGVTDAAYELHNLIRDHPQALYALFFGVAGGYILITLTIAGLGRLLERRLVVLR
ncbi:MAG: amino acid ABC transporter permease [Sporichthyaceae bacterium]|nr:amino acid ABC transporter permease [Sporichthyaceae bacterium]